MPPKVTLKWHFLVNMSSFNAHPINSVFVAFYILFIGAFQTEDKKFSASNLIKKENGALH